MEEAKAKKEAEAENNKAAKAQVKEMLTWVERYDKATVEAKHMMNSPIIPSSDRPAQTADAIFGGLPFYLELEERKMAEKYRQYTSGEDEEYLMPQNDYTGLSRINENRVSRAEEDYRIRKHFLS